MVFKSLDSIVFVFPFQLGFFNCLMERPDAAIIGSSVYWEWRSILSTMGKAELGWVFPAWACTVYEFGYQSQSSDSSWFSPSDLTG